MAVPGGTEEEDSLAAVLRTHRVWGQLSLRPGQLGSQCHDTGVTVASARTATEEVLNRGQILYTLKAESTASTVGLREIRLEGRARPQSGTVAKIVLL